jgi:hypothetical protein
MNTEYTKEEQARIDAIKAAVANFSADDIIASMLRHSMADLSQLNDVMQNNADDSGVDKKEAHA